MKIARRTYADHFGPTVGDRIRLGDTELFIEIEVDHAVYGDESKFGGGKVIREGWGSPHRPAVAPGLPTRSSRTPSFLITRES